MPRTQPLLELKTECPQLRAGQAETRGLLVRIGNFQRDDDESAYAGSGVDLSLVIDASGSMTGEPLQAAKCAAKGIIEHLNDDDRLSIVSFASEVIVHASNVAATGEGKRSLLEAVSHLRTRGCTNLAAGWHEGARQAALSMATSKRHAAHCVVLSDGHANEGVCDPVDLGRYAAELAARGVYSHCVGFSDHYSPVQLGAIAEHGGGVLHDAAVVDDIVTVLLGHLGETRRLAALDCKLTLSYPETVDVEPLSRYPVVSRGNGELVLNLGSMIQGANREAAFLLELGALGLDWDMPIKATLSWKVAATGELQTLERDLVYRVVEAGHPDLVRDDDLIDQIVELYEAKVAVDATEQNDLGNFESAAALVDRAIQRLRTWVNDDHRIQATLKRLGRLRERAEKVWTQDRDKIELLVGALKLGKGERDLRGQDLDWKGKL